MLRKEDIPGCGEVHIMDERPVSSNPKDHYLTYVIAFIPARKEWVTWMRNTELGGYHAGHYFFEDEEAAYDDYYQR